MNAGKSLQESQGRRFWTASLVGLVVLWLGFSRPLHAQTEASIFGTITDSTGAVLPGALVTVKSLETGSLRVVTSDEEGRYEAPLVAVGQYQVRAEQEGFRPEVRTGITLVVGQHAEVNLALRVGPVTEAVVVQEQGPLVSVTTHL